MKDVEDRWLRIQHSTEGLLCDGPGNLRFHLVADQKDDRYRSYRLTAPGKTPHINSMPLVAGRPPRKVRPAVQRTGTYLRAAAEGDETHDDSGSASHLSIHWPITSGGMTAARRSRSGEHHQARRRVAVLPLRLRDRGRHRASQTRPGKQGQQVRQPIPSAPR